MNWIISIFLITFSQQVLAINYYWCEKSENCVKAYGGCGRYYSVHRRYKELYEAKAHKGDRTVNCLAPTKADKKYKHEGQPFCVKKACRLRLPEKETKKI